MVQDGGDREPTNWNWEDQPGYQPVTQQEYEDMLAIQEDQLRQEEFEKRQRELEEKRQKEIEQQIHNQQPPQSENNSLEIGDVYYSDLHECWFRVIDWNWDEEEVRPSPVVEEVEVEEGD